MIGIVYEDDCLLVVDKPSGMLVIPAPSEKKASLVELLNKRLKETGAKFSLHPCHRIDKDSSGIVVFAKGKENQRLIMEQFEQRLVKKKYLAFVKGILEKEQGLLVSRIRAKGKVFKRKAILNYNVLAQREFWSVVSIKPETGRMHQIRIQFAQISHPLLGERLYAFGKDFEVNFRRLALHAQEISFIHPVTKKIITLKIPLAPDMRKFLDSHGLNQL